MPLNWVVLQGVLPHLDGALDLAAARSAGAAGRRRACRAERVGIVGYHEPSLLFALGGGIRLLLNGEEAAVFLAGGPGRVVAVGDRQEQAFRAAAAARGLALREMGSLTGFNYSRGRLTAISLYGLAE